MTDRLRVTPVEASALLVKDVYGIHDNKQIAQALHGAIWRDYYESKTFPLRFQDVTGDTQRSDLLISTVDQVLQTLTQREYGVMRLRYGIENGTIPILSEIGEKYDICGARIGGIIAKSLRKLRHPSRSKHLRDFLYETQAEEIQHNPREFTLIPPEPTPLVSLVQSVRQIV